MQECEKGPWGTPIVYAGHGGGGYILSIGLLRQLGWEGGKHCILDQTNCTGGDCLVTRCLQMYHKLAHTDPGPGLLHRGREWIMFDNPMRECAERSAQNLVAGKMSQQCRWLVRNGVSFHISVRSLGLEAAPDAVRNLSRAHEAARAYISALDD